MNVNTIITISRQYGSGGRAIGKLLADQLGIPFYDKELIELAAKESGFAPQMFEHADEQATNSLLYSLSMGTYTSGMARMEHQTMPLNDRVYVIQAEVIRKISDQGPCVIVGRCADHILRNRPNVLHVFIHAGLQKRVERAVQEYSLSAVKAESAVLKTDKRRATYHDFYADTKWGVAENYHLCINSDGVGVEGAAQVIATYVQRSSESND